mmetsp:Transcript_5109/g.5834  ORF Transcript_5109/g.5834 Transcript_5109/m.5834 type:complete len:284 (+) Transcript_5109:36-887(+)|eukprot:CAMPEP_0205829510 /NCGR_PEP_ID=MMETSP0206-20130828/38347_1 /ASSEMBLY_ACC=CAM_ASM_000279 /TAXON_ID=36767 /ORGANISM="Euplotes focardii, Strain TN1" /LENGTH=283 /DNA_ID=CAMNT_0053132295 /DNA_START=36 /DNA_END=887 /DNA_ORIENTATION=+
MSGYQRGEFQDGDEWLVPAYDGAPKLFRRKVTRKVEMPFIRQVKVPVITKKVVNEQQTQVVKTKKLVAVPDFEEAEEVFTEFQEKKGKREKKIWDEKVIMEDYVKKVPVTKTRTVRKAVTKIDVVHDFQIVQVPGTKVIQVKGFRIDTIEERKWVEEEVWEVVELKSHHTGRRIKGEERLLIEEESTYTKREGTQLYAPEDLAPAGVNIDDLEQAKGDPRVSAAPLYSGTNAYHAGGEAGEAEYARASAQASEPAGEEAASSGASRRRRRARRARGADDSSSV